MTQDYSKIWYSETPYDVNGSSTPTSGVQIISGRTRVHGIWVMNGSVTSSTIPLTRPMSLLESSGGSVLYKCALNNPVNQAEQNAAQWPVLAYENYFGGNGILFDDGVWFAIDADDQSGSTAASSKTAKYVAVLYTGGVNT